MCDEAGVANQQTSLQSGHPDGRGSVPPPSRLASAPAAASSLLEVDPRPQLSAASFSVLGRDSRSRLQKSLWPQSQRVPPHQRPQLCAASFCWLGRDLRSRLHQEPVASFHASAATLCSPVALRCYGRRCACRLRLPLAALLVQVPWAVSTVTALRCCHPFPQVRY